MTSSTTGPVSLRGSSVSQTNADLVKHICLYSFPPRLSKFITRKPLALQEVELPTASLNFALNKFWCLHSSATEDSLRPGYDTENWTSNADITRPSNVGKY